jgi:hypothetical protein
MAGAKGGFNCSSLIRLVVFIVKTLVALPQRFLSPRHRRTKWYLPLNCVWAARWLVIVATIIICYKIILMWRSSSSSSFGEKGIPETIIEDI